MKINGSNRGVDAETTMKPFYPQEQAGGRTAGSRRKQKDSSARITSLLVRGASNGKNGRIKEKYKAGAMSTGLSPAALPVSPAGKAVRTPRRGVMQVGIFFDGTGNDKSDWAHYTNIAKLEGAYAENNRDIFALYMRGVGTDRDFWQDIEGKAFGFGATERIEGMLFDLQSALHAYETTHGALPEKVTIDLFGFSRGAATGRHFMNVIKQGAFELDPPYDQLPENAFEFRFVGLADTVGSFYQPGDNDDGPYRFSIPKDWAYRVVHLVADDEYRANFDLQSLFENQRQVPEDRMERSYIEDVVPGAHADIGGSYSPTDKEHGLDNNLLSRIHLQRFLKEATDAGSPFLSLDRLVAKNPDHWRVDPRAKSDFEHLEACYADHPGLETGHKKLREIQHGLEYARCQLADLPSQTPNDMFAGNFHTEYLRHELERRIDVLEQAAANQLRKVGSLFEDQASTRQFLDFYNDFHRRYIHHSHAPVNKTPGMAPEVMNNGRLRREVFYKAYSRVTDSAKPAAFSD